MIEHEPFSQPHEDVLITTELEWAHLGDIELAHHIEANQAEGYNSAWRELTRRLTPVNLAWEFRVVGSESLVWIYEVQS